MNKLSYFSVFISLVLLWSCGKEDEPVVPLVPTSENSAPKIEAQSFTVAENILDDVTIGTITATDADQDELTFSITDSNLFEISQLGDLSLAEGTVLDFETNQQHIVKVNVTDNINVPVEIEVTVNVENVPEAIPEDAAAFVTTWKTTEDGESIRIGLVEALEYDFTINWGDGNIENVSTVPVDHLQAIFHDYEVAGDYTVSIIGKLPGVVMGIYGAQINLMSIEQWGGINWKTMTNAYANCENVVCNATDVPNLSQVTNIGGMFYLTLNFEGDLSDWDVSTITNMSSTFDLSNFNGDISQWETQNVTSMAFMFAYSAFNGDLSGWDTHNVTNMSLMFISTSFNGDISQWNTEKVSDMYAMFANASFSGDLSNWNMQNVTSMHSMFKGNTAFNSDISGWNTENVTTTAEMFNGASSFNQDLNSWNTEKVQDMNRMFRGATSFDQNLGDWNIQNIQNEQTMHNMLAGAGMSAENYSATLSGWATLGADEQGIPQNVVLGAGGINFCNGSEGEAARTDLINTYGWTITDDGGVDCQP